MTKKVEELTDVELLIKLGVCPECGREMEVYSEGMYCSQCDVYFEEKHLNEVCYNIDKGGGTSRPVLKKKNV